MTSAELCLEELANRARSATGKARHGSLSALTSEIRAALERSTTRAFEQARSPVDGEPWPPLQHRTGNPLVLTGLMRGSALAATRNATVSDDGAVTLLGLEDYAGFQRKGTRTIPAREFIGVEASELELLSGLLTDTGTGG